MRHSIIALVLCACVCLAAGDGSHFKAKARIIARLAGKHHKRGVLSSIPPYKLGHDIPHVTHSIVKPIVVTYPPTAAVSAVKVPLAHPLLPRYPVPVGHRVPVPHPHYGLKFPHHHKAVVVPKPDQHYHHHHHHVAPRPVIPVVPAAPIPSPVVPVAAPTFARPIPVPSPPVVLSSQVLQPALPAPVHIKPVLPAPAAPVFSYPQYAPQIPYVLRPGSAVQTSLFANYPRYPFLNYQGPMFPLHSSSFSQIVPHGHVPQYYPQGDVHDGVVIERPAIQVEPAQPGVHVHGVQPEVQFQAQPGVHHLHDVHLQHLQPGVLHAQPDVHLQPGVHVQQPEVHLHAAQPEIHLQPGVQLGQPDIHFHAGQPGIQIEPGQQEIHFHNGQPDVLQPGAQIQPGQPEVHFHTGQPGVQYQPGQQDIHYHGGQPDVHLQPGVQVNAAGQPNIYQQPGFNYQPAQPDFNIQPGQTDYHVHLGHSQPQPTQPTVDHNGWSPVPSQNDFGSANGHYPDDGHQQFDQGHQQFDQGHQQFDQGHQQFDQGHQQFDQGHQGYDQNTNDQNYEYQHQLQHHIQQQLDQAQYEQNHNNQHQLGQEYGAPNVGQSSQDYPQNHQPAPEYGLPQQGAEGRSAEGHTDEPEGDTQLYHNHIPLGLQPPIDRPLEHFR